MLYDATCSLLLSPPALTSHKQGVAFSLKCAQHQDNSLVTFQTAMFAYNNTPSVKTFTSFTRTTTSFPGYKIDLSAFELCAGSRRPLVSCCTRCGMDSNPGTRSGGNKQINFTAESIILLSRDSLFY